VENSVEKKSVEERFAIVRAPFEWIGSQAITLVEDIGQISIMAGQTAAWLVRPPYRIRVFIQALDSVGVGSLFIVAFTGLFTGLVLAYQSVIAFGMFNAETLVGGTVAVSLVRELGPVLTGLMVAGRTGSSMTTEIGTMRVTEQIDAMSVMAVNPVQYLVVPRVVAGVLTVPFLTLIFNFVGICAAYVLAVKTMGIDPGIFVQKIKEFIDGYDLFGSAVKGAAFGLVVALIGCYKGFYASGGARGVGEATTSSVVSSSIAILFIDYVLTLVLW
jgi:phospholipid/cholesterol/gamma-HCH transport system permease protein